MTRPTAPRVVLETAGGSPLEPDAVVAALSTRFTVIGGPGRRVRRRRLDTFDRRLRAAGLTLEHETGAGAERLVLARTGSTSRDEEPVTQPVTGARWPALADAVSAGPVRDLIAPATGIRAVLVIADSTRRTRSLELRNDDGKLVVRIELDEPASTGADPAHVTVHALRGYGPQARRAADLLISLGLRPIEPPADRAPDGGPPPSGGDRNVPATVHLTGVLSGFVAAMRENLPGLLDDVDTEFLHDFRVALRRTRSTLKLGRPVLPEVMRTRWEPAFKELGDLTTPVRDLDVYLLSLPTIGGWLVAADPAELTPLAAHLRHARAIHRRTLVRALRSASFQRLLTQWEQALTEVPDAPRDGDQEPTSAGQLASRTISRAHRIVVRAGAAITAESPAQDLHDLRKRCKELRYALEVFAGVIDEGPRKRAISDLKGLQDVLGRFQDSEVQRRTLRELAEEMMADGTKATALLAMGELIGHLDAEQDRAREEFDSAFARFRRRSGTGSQRLGGSA
jgi:CHAD domain-containing protein